MNRPVIITGASGFVGAHLAAALGSSGFQVVAVGGARAVPGESAPHCISCEQADLTDPEQCDSLCSRIQPAAIIHAAAIANVSRCQSEPEAAFRANAGATQNLLRSLANVSASTTPLFVLISTDMVFDGTTGAPVGGFAESDRAQPVSVYSQTKRAAEESVIASHLDTVILRTALVYGKKIGSAESFLGWVERGLEAGDLPLFDDEYRTPVAVADLCQAVRKLLEYPPGTVRSAAEGGDRTPILHLSGPERLSRVALGRIIARAAGLSEDAIRPCSRLSVPSPVPRPGDISLNGGKLFHILGLRTLAPSEGIDSIRR